MPSGKTHLRTELIALPLVALIFYLTLDLEWNDLGLFSLSYLVSSLWLSPDLDLKQNNTRNRWGALSWIWVPYSRIFKHRGLSHHILWGPLTRLFYLTLLLYAIVLLLDTAGLRAPGELTTLISTQSLLVLLAGLYVPNAIHALMDSSASFMLQIRKNKQKQRDIQKV